MHTHTEQPSSENDRRTRTRPYGTTCKFLHRHEATKGGAAYNDLLPSDYDKRQWNAMPTVRNSPAMPFVSQNCAGEFTGL